MKRHTIHLHPLGKELLVNDQTPLIDHLHEFGVEFPCGGKGTCGKCRIKLLEGEIEVSDIHRNKLDRLGLEPDIRLACLSNCTGPITLEVEQYEQIILADESTFEFTPENGCGIAIDLGTTTLVAQLLDLSNAHILAVETMLNPQVKFGADLISRIQAGLDGHAVEMTELIRNTLGTMIRKMAADAGVMPDKVVLVGNTVMQQIFCGEDLTPLSAYPFQTNHLGERCFQAEELNWELPGRCRVTFFPSIGSFVGSDILAGIAATGMHQKEKFTALIDLGTNGEIVVGNRERILCASTAAGPAFEGANLSMGMRAVTGAVSSIALVDKRLLAAVIGRTEPRGICGSALIDAVALLQQLGEIGEFGEISSGADFLQIVESIQLTQKDLYEFLLAKSAIAAGMAILARELAIDQSDITETYIAGGFGNYINLEHLLSTGMVETTADKIHKMGNTALIGAKMFLFGDGQLAKGILAKSGHVNLEGIPDFQDIYISKMILG